MINNKNTIIYLLLIFLSIQSVSIAKKFNADEFILIINKQDAKLSSNTELKFQINSEKANQVLSIRNSYIEINSFPISSNEFDDLELYPVQVAFDQNTEWHAGTKDGMVKMSPPKLTAFQGKIKSQPNSYVFINYNNGFLFSYIKDEEGYVNSISPNINKVNSNEHIITSHISVDDHKFVCHTNNSHITTNESEDIIKIKHDETLANNMLELKIACEGTYDFYALLGSDFQKASAYIASVITQVSKIYQDNINVNLLISYVLIWQEESKDPYRGTENLADKLTLMPELWLNKSVDRAITCLFADLSNQPPNTTVAGIAFSGSPNFGTLCNRYLGYSVFGIRGNGNYPTMNYTWDVNCAAHEIGHNFSSPHTHNCDYFVPPIDTCITATDPGGIYDACIKSGRAKPIYGTIMSYCHLTHSSRSVDLNFHPRCKTIMRKAAENAKCSYVSQSPKVFLVDPLGEKNYKANSEIKIRWRASNVNNVNIKYSLDSGLTWVELKSRVNASDNEILWLLPNITVWNVMVLVENTDNPTIFDKSLKTFSIVAPAINLENPNQGDKFGHRETLNLSWTSFFVDSVRIEFSSDGGNKWDTVIEKVSGYTYKWIIPTVSSLDCKIRLISLPEESVITESPIFGIGTQSAKIIKPNGGEVICASSTYDIEWTSDFVNTVFIEYTVNNGESWQRVTLGSFKPNTTSYAWNIPLKPTDRALLRLYTKPDTIVYLDTTDNYFKIDTCLTDISETANYNKTIDWVELQQIQTAKSYNLKYKLNSDVNFLSIDLFDLLGNKLTNILTIQQHNPGIYENVIELPELSQGNYFIVFKSDIEYKVFTISIIN